MIASGYSVKRAVIVGLPNTGKSQVFNNLTDEYTLVGNYPFTTVETARARCRIGKDEYEVFDTPGFHCLYIHSEEELIVRDFLFEQKPDVIIQCVDANRLKQSLSLTADLLELKIPMVIVLNAIDETTRKGMWIDSQALSTLLGVSVVESVAINGIGTDALKRAISRARISKVHLTYGEIMEDAIARIQAIFPDKIVYSRKVALLSLLNDPFLDDYLQKHCDECLIGQLNDLVRLGKSQYNKGSVCSLITQKRTRWVAGITEKVINRHAILFKDFSQGLARLSRHPISGIPILLGVLFLVFFSVVNIANSIATWLHTIFWVPIEEQVAHLVPAGFWTDFLIGDYGVLTLGVSNAILTVLPILSVFFLLFNILEDIGYLPNLCVLSNRVAKLVGLSGNAILPITLGFGCKTMGTLTTKSLRSPKERYISIYLIAFALPCAAQMALNMSILGRMGVRAFVIAVSALFVVEIAAGLVLNKVLKSDEKKDFLQELPDMRMPSVTAVLKKTYYKLWWFLKEAMPIFVIAAVVLFVADTIGILDSLKYLLKPIIVSFLGFPLNMVDVLILCMAKHEAAAGMMIQLIQRGDLNYIQSIVAVTLTTMFVPCVANMVAMIKELGAKKGIPMIFIINATAVLAAGILNWGLVVTIGH